MAHSNFIHGLSALRPENINPERQGCVVTIGSFDGVHLGHRQLLNSVMAKARQTGLPSVAMIFEPQPYEFFSKEEAPSRLSRLREKVNLLLELGIDTVVCLKFNQALRSLTADEYIQEVLVSKLEAKHIVVGDDFKFGCDRSGNFAKLKAAGEQLAFSVMDTETLLDQKQRISSTRIRQLLIEDKLIEAGRLLGRPYSILGKVFYGNQLGGKIGFPTANIALGRFCSPVNGVFAVTLKTLGEGATPQEYQGVANVGLRPSIASDGRNKKRPILEVHIFDFDKNIYGNFVEVAFCQKIRSEKKFSNIDELRKQIKLDTVTAKKYFSVAVD